jgi:dihydrofolate reductase
MAVSANWLVAGKDGNEDFLSHENWIQMMKYVNKYWHLIWWRKTYELVGSRDKKYMKDLKKIPIIIVSTKKNLKYPENVTVCSSPEEALIIVESKGFKKAMLSGWPKLNTSFAKAWLLNKIILNFNPVMLLDWIKLFEEINYEMNLKVLKIKNISDDIVQIHYLVNHFSKNKISK